MIVISEKVKIVGTLKTLVGTYPLLDLEPKPDFVLRISDGLWFNIIDEENFSGSLFVRGDFIIIPSQIPVMKDVRIISQTEVAHETD